MIERELVAGRLDPQWLQAYRNCVGLGATADDCLPPLALQIAGAPLHMAILSDARFPFPAMGLVHMSQTITQSQKIPADAVLVLRAFCCAAREEKRGMSFALVTEARLAGELVWRGETRALAISRARPAGSSAAAKVAETQPADELRHAVRVMVPEDIGRRYAAIAGDLNPIHQRAWMARLFGFRRAIVHGTWTMARALADAGFSHWPAYTLEAHFRRPVELPSEILIRAYGQEQGQQRVAVSSPDGRTTFIDLCLSAGFSGFQ